MQNERRIICNRIITPDGTELISHGRHDFVGHEDANGKIYCVDGGKDYLRRVGPSDYKDATIWSDDPFEVIREHLYRGSRGKDGTQPLTYIKLKDMSDDYLTATIDYNDVHGYGASYNTYYEMEIQYRKDNNIKIEE
jgi:hypothetical protein